MAVKLPLWIVSELKIEIANQANFVNPNLYYTKSSKIFKMMTLRSLNYRIDKLINLSTFFLEMQKAHLSCIPTLAIQLSYNFAMACWRKDEMTPNSTLFSLYKMTQISFALESL